MNLQVKLALKGVDLKQFSDNVQKALAVAVDAAAETMGQRALLAVRADTRAGGLGDKVANAWQLKVYPVAHPTRSLHPAAQVFSKAPLIVQAFAEGATIQAIGGTYLAIPTENVPQVARGRGHGIGSVRDIELLFGKPIIKKSRNGNLVVFVDAIAAKNGKGYRPATKGRLKQARKQDLILMFILVKQVHLQKRLNYPAIFDDMQSQWESVLGETVSQALAD